MDLWDKAYMKFFNQKKLDKEDKTASFITGCMFGRYMAQIHLCKIFDKKETMYMHLVDILHEFAARSSEELKLGTLPEESLEELRTAVVEIEELGVWLRNKKRSED